MRSKTRNSKKTTRRATRKSMKSRNLKGGWCITSKCRKKKTDNKRLANQKKAEATYNNPINFYKLPNGYNYKFYNSPFFGKVMVPNKNIYE